MDILIVAEQFYDHSKFIRGLSKETLKNYKDVIKFFAKSIEVSDVSEITDKIVREFFIYGRMHRKWKPKTFFSYHKILVVFFRYCITNGYMTYNFARDIECPKMPKSLPKKIPTDDALRLLEVIMNYPFTNNFLRYRNHAIFSTFIYTGLRRSELLNLKVVDVDIENRTIFVRNGKGAKDRILPMSHTLAQRLTRYIQERRKKNKTCPEFFASNNKNQGFTDGGLRHLTRELRKVCNIEFTIHRLRHTFATLMIEGGCDIYSLSKMMGHSDISTTTIYLSTTTKHLRGQIMKHPLNA